MNQRELTKALANGYDDDRLLQYFREASLDFKPESFDLTSDVEPDPDFIQSINKLGEIEFEDNRRLIVVTSLLQGEITEKTSRKKQFEIGWKLLKKHFYDAGIFVFRDERGHYRFSLIVTKYTGNKREHTPFRRYTYYVNPDKPNKTFVNQIGKADFSDIESVLKAFSIDAVSKEFYDEFKPKFNEIASEIQGTDDSKLKEDFALLFVIRVIFIGFVQKRGWLGDKEEFVQEFWTEYKNSDTESDTFYGNWLKPLFFEALNSAPGKKVKYQNNFFSKETEEILQMAPYLNGELFSEKRGVDDQGFWIPDKQVGNFLEFLFQYNFTIEENTFYDEELELNPEFLGIIFERLVNKEDGAIYTPRTEVDFMCRMGLVKWLQNNTSVETDDLYHLFFRNQGQDPEFNENQKQGDFTTAQIRELVDKLTSVTVCDPAAGSGAFEVGMMQVLHDILKNLYQRSNAPEELPDWGDFEQKKSIIARSLYGVEVKEWAVWINHLRLWLTLFIDMPDDYKDSLKPLLPSLNFKVRQGDSLVQRVGNKLFPVQGHAHLSSNIKRKITELKKAKVDFFYNRGGSYDELRGKENSIFRAILDDEIQDKRKLLKGFSNPRGIQKSLVDDGGPIQTELESDEKDIKKLKAEIAELEEQKNSLGENHPLIWNIEFSEIFFDRGGFDIVIGNPPYVRQEGIGDPLGKLEAGYYKKELKAAIRGDYPDYFRKGVDISGKSDLYTYFYIRSLRILNDKGELIFICSNSWLDVGYGAWLQRFLLRKVDVHGIVDNHDKRSFANVDVNTVITFMSAPKKHKTWKNCKIPFIAFKKPFEEVLIAEHLLAIENASETVATDMYRVFPVKKKRIAEEGSEFENPEDKKMGIGTYVGDKWGGKYLRAPDIFFTILEKGEGKLVKLKEIADVKFGIKTGCNEFFYLTNEEAVQWEIEDEFLVDVIKSPRECKTMEIDADELKFKIFMCHKDKNELQGTNALKYIEWGERQEKKITQGKNKGSVIKGFHNISSVQGRKRWYDLGQRSIPPIVIPCSYRKNFLVYKNYSVLVDKRLYELNSSEDPNSFALSLNSILYPFFLEILSRSYGGGGGPIDATVEEIEQVYSLSPDLLKGSSEKLITDRKVKTIFKECGINPESEVPISDQEPEPLPDRAELDNIVFDALGLNQEERKEVYRAVCQLVWNRINRAQNV